MKRSKSKILRDFIYVLWTLRQPEESSEAFYEKIMNKFIDSVKEKIDFDKKFMEEQTLLSADYS